MACDCGACGPAYQVVPVWKEALWHLLALGVAALIACSVVALMVWMGTGSFSPEPTFEPRTHEIPE